MKKVFLSLSLGAVLFGAQEFEANLEAHFLIPAKSFIEAPQDAGEFLQSTGKFSKNIRNENFGSVESNDYALPFKNQALQGHSGIKYVGKNQIWILSDNGLGTKKNSPDSMLFIHKYELNFKTQELRRLETVFFNDKNRIFPYLLNLENTQSRYFTGSDLDPESFQIVGEDFWIGDEFGPFLLQFDKNGTLKASYETFIDGQKVLSPDHPGLVLNTPEEKIPYNIKRSKGFEAMASSKDGKKLYPMLEFAMFRDGAFENENGKNFLRILEFDVKKKKFTGKSFKYFTEDNAHSIGDFNMIDKEYGLIIERDDGEGVEGKGFKNPAKFKRIYKVKLDAKSGVAKKVAYIDLMRINDKKGLSKKDLVGGKFVFPFMTIENVDVVDANTIIVANDNNFPFSASREPKITDDNEIILLEVGDFLRAK
ncbi:esterase-like activity of phytase family protein [Campylobacter sp.]|uniref:esterase-like activity of phytase family protein n=1 Tax=Campylobacter sp. TaxID=205 RepID=UPI0026DCDC57|nr:esterase-like activity of phytase family protein [Campylobacter sp.]MDO4673995.1 esterase-like activity of phytase family protein [Campylobacter sp.]